SSLNKIGSHTKTVLRDIGRRFGFEIRLSGVNSRDDLRFVHFLELHKIDTVLDVGANRGQFATELYRAGFQGRIISFEPLPDAYAVLTKAAADFGERWTVGPCVALSDKTETTRFFVTEADRSSSLLEPLDSFIEATPIVRVEENIEVQTERLDKLVGELNLDDARAFLKLDVQGSEAQVLAGASETIENLHGVLIELSFANLYAGQSSAIAILQLMSELGFEVWDIWRGYHNPKTRRLNQVDALFFKAEAGTETER
ncbi:MAG TPA: FkbM family methyltransferase, partial [Desulfobacterales bacterium]|nr:FkbM family methyltransferase [Desulfobacterales bacterium]